MTNRLQYELMRMKRTVINRWLTSGIFETKMKFVPMTMEGDINDWLIQGFSVHENPCRKEFVTNRRSRVPAKIDALQALPGTSLALGGQEKSWEVYFPWGNPRVEWSGFWFVPTHLCTYAVTNVVASTAHQAKLVLRTCGGLTLWLNGNLVTDFVPFTRNIEQETELTVELQEGLNELVICCEDLAERDTHYYFSIEYEGPEAIRIQMPLDPSIPEEHVKAVELAMEDAYFPKDVVTSGDVKLMMTNPLKERLSLSVLHGNVVKDDKLLEQGAAEINLGEISGFDMDFTVMLLQTKVGSVNISKRVALQLFPKLYEGIQVNTIKERKQQAISFIADHGKSGIPRAIALIHTGRDVSLAKELIRKGKQGINERRDCSDFEMIGLFKLWKEYRHTELFEPGFWEEVKSCVLNYRYWIDEPGDDVMWFFSENHALMFHACQLFSGQLFPEDIFTNSGESGLIHRQKGEKRLLQWFERFFAEGLAEWNSSAYIPIDVAGLLHIYDLAESEELRTLAKQAMDLLYRYMAVNAHQGFVAATFGRSYEKELKGHYTAGTSSLCWIGYGVGILNPYTRNVILCLTDYEPPKAYEPYLKVAENEQLIYKNEQGKGGYAKLYMYKRTGYAMSSVYNYRPGLPGYQEHVVEAFFTPEAQVWVNHPGERNCFGTGRPSYWAGNGYLPKVAQYKGLCILMYRIDPKHSVDFTHAYFPVAEFDRTEQAGGWHFAEKNGAYIAVYAQNGTELMKTGPDRGRELRSIGYDNVWLLRASDRRESGSFEQFMNDVCAMELKVILPSEVSIADRKYGSLQMQWEGHLSVNGIEQTEDFGGVTGRVERITS